MLTLVIRRARHQRRLLVALVALVAASATLIGICSLLLGVTQDRGFRQEIQRAQPPDVAVTAYLLDVPGPDLASAQASAEQVERDVLVSLRPTVTSSATGRMRRLGTDRLAYLATDDALAQRADLISGRWPAEGGAGRRDAAVPDTTARLLGLRLGDRLTLGRETGVEPVDTPVTVRVVGTFRARPGPDWDTDPLSGTGFDAGYSDGTVTAPAYGPFVIGRAAFAASGSSVSSLQVTAHPDLALADESSLRAAVERLDPASALLASRVEAASVTRVGSDLAQTLDRVRAQQASTRSTVLVVLLLGVGLALAAALLAGRLVASLRDDERDLLVAFGLSRRQQLLAALVEALLIAAAAALVAVPVAAVIHSRLTHLPALRAAGLTVAPTVTAGLVIAVLVGALLLTVVLVVTAVRGRAAPDPTASRRVVIRSGLDVLLVAVMVLAWWQLRSQDAGARTGGDIVLTVAPVIAIAAATVVTVRLVSPVLGAVARAATRSRALVVPLAVQQAARRPDTGTAMVLITSTVAAAVFGLALRTTWEQSQADQATSSVGTDLSVALGGSASPGQVAAIAAAVADGAGGRPPDPVVSVVVDRPLALGRYVGDAGTRPVLVAVDTRHAGALLRGRLDPGASWSEVTASLSPAAPAGGLPLPDGGTGVELEGRTPSGPGLTVTPTAVVQDATGFRRSVVAGSLALDGRSHPVRWSAPLGTGQRLIGVRLDLDGAPDATAVPASALSVTLRIPGHEVRRARSWSVQPLDEADPLSGVAVRVGPGDAGTELRMTAQVDVTYLAYGGGSMVATAFAPPSEVPVAVSQDLARTVGTKVGGTVSAVVGDTAVSLLVTAIVPTVPSAPGQVAVLADSDLISRALIGAGSLDPPVDAVWVGHPGPRTARELRSLMVGEVTTRQQVATELAQGPVRVAVPTALLTLVLAAGLILLAGVMLVLGADRKRRSVEVARLRALGLTRQDARRLLLVEHAVFLVPLVLVGALVGAAAAVLLGPHLIRSDTGAAPVPAAVVAWSWAGEAVLVGVLLLGSLVIATLMAAYQAHRSDLAHLSAGDG